MSAPSPDATLSAPPSHAPPRGQAVELHSIDFIPADERHGTPRHLGAIWFVSNINLTGMATGVTALSIGAGLMWTVLATVVGSLFGTFFMAFHSAQGPQLGLPQLVQSRPQFGYIGAAVTIWVFALINYVAYNTSDAILSGDAMHTLFHLGPDVGYFIAALVAAAIALFGYRWIHKVSRWLTWPLLAIMIVLSVASLADAALPKGAFDLGAFHAGPVMTVFVIVAGFQLGWAPYVSDYSRYLPARVGVRATFWWTYLPSALSAVWVFIIGAIASAADPTGTPVDAFKSAADSLFGGLGWIVVAALLVGLLTCMAINQYGGMMSMISIKDSFSPVQPTRRIRAICIAAMFLLVWGVAQFVGVDRFNSFYGNALIFLAYVFTPWTAINLVDYFFVRRGLYAIREIFNPHGMYGRWGWRGNLAYLVGILTMVPFMVSGPFTGILAQHLGDADYSMFIGLPVAGLVYLWSCRGLDLAAERRVVIEEGILTVEH